MIIILYRESTVLWLNTNKLLSIISTKSAVQTDCLDMECTERNQGLIS